MAGVTGPTLFPSKKSLKLEMRFGDSILVFTMHKPLANSIASANKARVAQLRTDISNRFRNVTKTAEAKSSGFAELDQLLAHAGFQHGTLVDWLYATGGNGGGTLALLSAAHWLDGDNALVVIDPQRQFFPPAAASLGIDLNQLVLVHPKPGKETLWTWEQSLRSPAAGVVWGLLPSIEPRAFRRLQLAAEAGRAVGHLVRSADLRSQPCWCHTQLLVEGGKRQRVTVTRSLQGRVGQSVEIEPVMRFNHASIPFPLAATMAHPAVHPRAIGA